MTPAVVIQSASVQDRNGGIDVVEKLVENWKKIVKIFADGGYSGTLVDKIKERFKITVEIMKRDEAHHFKVLPKRWIVERTLNYERLNQSSVAMVHLLAIRVMLNRF